MPNLKTSIKDLRKSKRRETINDRLRNRVKRVTKKHSDLLKRKIYCLREELFLLSKVQLV